ncbi:HN1_G0037220.mRNA.1.CDS.1 [Saccharomyces cerevisiae]|nr:HN1_G0037220.mRNA.1.CDS.1 [Saccharomyces cerevisiae]CAI4737744.1 BAL_1a_G0048130.mRNA.1.CDS.1 [Saccharomyces cerevisiae]CAI7327821.1 BAL_1a_G0048130.mRNA.1.CDS.1 [Saccharomyces cerevisiae]
MKAGIELISHSQAFHATHVNSMTLAEKGPQRLKKPFKEHSASKESNVSRWLKILRRQFDIWFPETIPTMKVRYELLKKNFIKEIFNSRAFIYPFLGFYEVLTNPVYWKHILLFAVCYALIFVTIAGLFYVTLVPLLVTWAILLLGPLGVILVHIQWILQTNVLTAFVCRTLVLTHITNQIFDISLVLQDQDEFLNEVKVLPKPQKPHRKIDEPDAVRNFNTIKGSRIFKIPKLLFRMFFKVSNFTSLTLLSLIPIVGPILANQLMAPKRTFTYLQRYFLLKGFSKKQAKDFQYEHYASFICFGMSAGLLELIPFFTIVTISSNTVGAAKWCSSLLKGERKKE